MKHNLFLLTSLLMIALLFAACSPQGDTTSGPVKVEDLGSLTEALRDAGATIESNGTVKQDFFTVEGQILKFNGMDVQVFEYESAEAMEAEAELVALDGGSIGTSMVSWIATPHFFKAGTILVLYIGDDSAVLNLLKSALGEQFAGK